MPLIIKELHIKVAVNPPSGPAASGSGSAPAAGNANGGQANQEEIIAACIEQIMEILQEKMEA